jgi:phage major head subunit gpT-like protein
MAGNMFQIGNQVNLEAARVGFHAAFMSKLEATGPDGLEALYAEVPSGNSIEEHNWLGDLPGFEEWKGDRKLSEFDAFKLRVVNRDWANGIRVHQNNFKDDKLGLFGVQVAMLAQKARRHRADLCVKAMLNGFTGNAFPEAGNGLAYDGALFFSNSHSSSGGPAQSNKLTTALSAASLETAEQMLGEMKTADGKDPLDLQGTHIICGPKLRAPATKLVTSELVPSAAGTASESNIHRGKYEVIVSRRITGAYDDYWFLADLSAPIRPMIFQLREDISSSAIMGGQGGAGDSVPRFKAGEYWFGAEARYNVAHFAWQTIIGSAL